MHLYPTDYFLIYDSDLFKQYLNFELNTLVTKYTDILIFNFAHIIISGA